MSDIFVSYSSKDRPWVKALAQALQSEGWSVWWDREIATGQNFYRVLEEELNRARCVLVIWSENSVRSDWVPNEASEGLKRGILIPIAMDASTPPLVFRQLQTADLANWAGDRSAPEYRRIVADIGSLLAAPPRPEGVPPARPEPRSKKPTGKTVGTSVKAALAVIALLALGYFGLKQFYAPDPQILSFQAVPASTKPGEPVTLSWQTRNASQVQLEGIGPVALTGQHKVDPRETRNYTLVATNRRGRSLSRITQVAIVAPIPVPLPEPAKPNWIRIENHGGYVAKFYVSWEQGQQWRSGSRPVGYAETIPLPQHVKTVWINAQEHTGFKWKTIFEKRDAPVQRTYTVTGTTLHPDWRAFP